MIFIITHSLFEVFALWRYFASQIFFHHQAADRYSIGCAETCIFYIYANGNLWIVFRGKSHKSRVVAAVWVLCGTSFPTYFHVAKLCVSASSAHNGHSHTLYNVVVIFAVDGGVVTQRRSCQLKLICSRRLDQKKVFLRSVSGDKNSLTRAY